MVKSRYGVIYLITNVVTGKYYVGQTTSTTEKRWRQHVSGSKGCRLLRKSIDKYGAEAFIVETVFECNSQDALNALERQCILALMSYHPSNGYNLTTGGDGYKRAEESCKKISNTIKSTPSLMQSRKEWGHSRLGSKATAEVRLKMSKAKQNKKRKTFSNETRLNMSIAQLTRHERDRKNK